MRVTATDLADLLGLTGGEQIRTTISNTSMPPEEYFR